MDKPEKDDKIRLPHRLHHDTFSPMATYRGLAQYYFLNHEKMTDDELVEFFQHIELTCKKIDSRNERFSEIIDMVQELLDLQEAQGGPYEVMLKLGQLNQLLQDINDKKK